MTTRYTESQTKVQQNAEIRCQQLQVLDEEKCTICQKSLLCGQNVRDVLLFENIGTGTGVWSRCLPRPSLVQSQKQGRWTVRGTTQIIFVFQEAVYF